MLVKFKQIRMVETTRILSFLTKNKQTNKQTNKTKNKTKKKQCF